MTVPGAAQRPRSVKPMTTDSVAESWAMKILATCLPGLGHLNPMVPLLRVLASRGHELEVVVPQPFVHYVERAGLSARSLGPAWTEAGIEDIHPGWRDLDGAAQLRVWTEFATRFEPHLSPYVEAFAPDVVVHDHFEFAAWLAAERLGIPSVPYAMTVRVDPALVTLCDADGSVATMREAAGLDPSAGVAPAARWLYLDALPPSLTAALLPPPETVHHVRHVADDRTAGGLLASEFTDRATARPLVYVTLGTVFNRAEGVLAALVEGAARVDADVLVTVGEDGFIPAELPVNVRAERYVPQADLYPHLDAVVCHGGFGTVFGALSHGIPVACAPIAADQTVNAALVDGASAGCNLAAYAREGALFPELRPGEPHPADVAEAVERLLQDPALRAGAAAIAEELSQGAPPEDAADLVERLVSSQAPISRR